MTSYIMDAVRLALRITTTAFDDELTELIEAGKADLGVAGVTLDDDTDPLIRRAVITYVRMHFGQPDEFDRLKASYDEQKAQLSTCTGYTDWGEANG